MMFLFALLSAIASNPVALNAASVQELASIDGVSASFAERIVQLREQRGHLGSVDELRILPGVREDTLDTLRGHVAVDIEVPLGAGQRFNDPQAVIAHFANEPSPQQVQAWANTYAKMSPDNVRKWLNQSKRFALLPVLWVRYRLTQSTNQDFNYYAQDGQIDTDGEVLFNVLDKAGVDQRREYMVQARWDLNKLIMSSQRARIIRENRNVVKLRDKILTEVNRMYFERRRIQAEMLLSPKTNILGQTKDTLRVMELTANLDALTGGRFSAAMARRAPNVTPR